MFLGMFHVKPARRLFGRFSSLRKPGFEFESKLKRFVVVLVLDRQYTVKQVAVTSKIDADIIWYWIYEAKEERESESRVYGDRVVPLFSPLLGDMTHYERAHGIPKNPNPDLENWLDDESD